MNILNKNEPTFSVKFLTIGSNNTLHVTPVFSIKF